VEENDLYEYISGLSFERLIHSSNAKCSGAVLEIANYISESISMQSHSIKIHLSA
jgi:hypothetical protein